MRCVVVCAAIGMLAGCASGQSIRDLNCDEAFGHCSASIEQQGDVDWWVVTDVQYAVVTMEDGQKLPVFGYKRFLGVADTFSITACQACILKDERDR